MIWTGTSEQIESLASGPQNLKDCYMYSPVTEGVKETPSPSPPGYPENCNQSHWPGYDSPYEEVVHDDAPYLVGGPNPYPLNSETMEPWTTWRSLEKSYNFSANAPLQTKKPVIGLIELGQEDFSMDDYECLRRATGAKKSHIEIFSPPGDTTANRHSTVNVEAQLDVQVAATVNQNADIYFIS